MKSYLKFLSRNKLYTAIEAVGLIVSLALFVIIATSVRDQLRIAKPAPGQENLYLLGQPADPSMEYRSTEALAAFPEVKRTAAYVSWSLLSRVGDENRRAQVAIADPALLDMFPLSVRSGDPGLFQAGRGALITESAARKYYPDRDPIGQEVLLEYIPGVAEAHGIEAPVPVPIAAVVEDPDRTLLDFELMVSIQCPTIWVRRYRESDGRHTGTIRSMHVFADLVPGADLEAFSQKYAESELFFVDLEKETGVQLTPYQDLYFSDFRPMGLRQGKRLYLTVLIVLGLILLLSALLNYVNLSLAASGARAKEMATRQLVGDSRWGVLLRSLAESILFVACCYVLALLLADALLPWLNSLKPAGISVPFRLALDGGALLLAVAVVLVLGGLAGIVPALSLASWRPIDVVSGRLRRRRKMLFNRVCVAVQAALALVLIVMSLTLGSQLRYLCHLDLGISPDRDVYYFAPAFTTSAYNDLHDVLASSPLAEEIAAAQGFPTHVRITGMYIPNVSLRMIYCDSTAFRLLGFRVRERWEELHPGLIWLTEETQNTLNVTQENAAEVFSNLMKRRFVSGVGGVMEEYRKYPVGAKLPEWKQIDQELSVVLIVEPGEASGLLVRTGPDHAAFERWFRQAANAIYREKFGFGDIFASKENFYECGYLSEIVARDYDDLHCYVRLVRIFCLMAVLLAMLGLLAMSTWYAGTQAKDIAIRKVFGGTVGSETQRGIWSYMLWVGIAVVVALPLSVLIVQRFLESWPERIGGCWWIFLVSVLLLLAIAFVSVVWQTLKAARTNPAVELKKE